MLKIVMQTLAVAVFCLPGAEASAGKRSKSLENEQKEIAVEILIRGLAGGDRAFIEKHVAERYIQHNPRAADGRAGLLAYMDDIASQASPLRIEPIRVIADGDLVAVHSVYTQGGTKKVVFDLFRFKGLTATEHWDTIQSWEEKTASGRTMIDGHAVVLDRPTTEDNRRLVRAFYDEVIIGAKLDSIDEYLRADYAQHNPQIQDGPAGLAAFFAYLQAQKIPFRLLRTHRSIAEGNFVLLHSEGQVAGSPHAFFDLFRVEAGRIVEHWDVVQAIPEKAEHNNGMF